MIIKIEPINGRMVSIVQTGPNWDKGTNYVIYKRIEFTSPDHKDVFTSLLEKYNDPHKCGVLINASNFDFNSFYSVDAKFCIITVSEEDSWFQIELTKGEVQIDAVRLRRCNPGKLKSFKIIATDDVNKTTDSWHKLIEVEEKSEEKSD